MYAIILYKMIVMLWQLQDGHLCRFIDLIETCYVRGGGECIVGVWERFKSPYCVRSTVHKR